MPWGVAAAAVAAGGSYLSAKESKKGSKTSEPGYLQDAEKDALSKASTISERQYTPYDGDRVAGLSANEQSASNLARSGSDQARSMYGKASDSLGSMEDYSSSALEKYQSPYIEGVLQPQIREQNTAYGQARTKLLNSKAGAFGGDRAALEESQLEKGHRQAISDVTGKTYSDAFQNAQSAFFTDQNRKVAASDAYNRVGGNLSALNTSEIQDLMATGGVGRMIDQGVLDSKYSSFLEARDWDVNNLQPLLSTISASKGGNSSSTQVGGGAGAFGQALGAAATVAGAYFGAKNDQPNTTPEPVQISNPGGNGLGRELGL